MLDANANKEVNSVLLRWELYDGCVVMHDYMGLEIQLLGKILW